MTDSISAFVGSASEWDAFASRQRGFTAFHRHAMPAVIAAVFGHPIERYCVRDRDGQLAGVLASVHVRSRLFGRFFISMPFVNYGGPLGTDAAVAALARHADERATATQADLLELRSAIELPISLPVSHRKVTMVLALAPGGPDAVFKGFKAKLRSQIRRPDKEGVSVRVGVDQLDGFYRVFCRHMRDLGTPTMPRAWFRELADAYGDDFWIACAWKGGEPIACGAGFRWHDEFEITWASALRAHNAYSPNMAVYWTLIERASREGLTRFNFGRCSPDSPTHRFKAQWGALEEPLYWYQGSGQTLAGTPRADSPSMALATRLWRRLPLALTNQVGPRVVRYLP